MDEYQITSISLDKATLERNILRKQPTTLVALHQLGYLKTKHFHLSHHATPNLIQQISKMLISEEHPYDKCNCLHSKNFMLTLLKTICQKKWCTMNVNTLTESEMKDSTRNSLKHTRMFITLPQGFLMEPKIM